MTFEFTATVWRHQGNAAWYFLTLPHGVSDEIEEITAPNRSGFGSVRVEVAIGGSTWRTSLFPDTRAGAYVLPVKRAIRDAEELDDGDRTAVALRLVAE